MSKLVLRSTLATRIARQSLNDRMNLCSKCEKPVSFEEDVCSVGSEIYHPKCFRCAECNKAIKPNEYMLQNGENTCFDCYNNNELRTCAKCGEMIQGLSVKRKGEPFEFHSKCIECNLCSEPLDPQHEAGSVCFNCYKLRLYPIWNNADGHIVSEDL